MPRRSRAEIRWASLRAAAKVALFAGSMACGAEATTLSQQAIDAGERQSPDAALVAHPDAAPTPDATAADAAFEMDAAVADVGSLDFGSHDVGEADTGAVDTGLADAGPQTICGFFPETQEALEAWQACCSENWDDPGCQVWGPPAPPSMEIA